MTNDSDYLDLNTLAKRLSLSTRTIRTYIQAVGLPAYRVSGKYLFSWHEVADFLARHRVKTTATNMDEQIAALTKRERP